MKINENTLSSFANFLIRDFIGLYSFSDIYCPTRREEGRQIHRNFGVDSRVNLDGNSLFEVAIQYKASKECIRPNLVLMNGTGETRKQYFERVVFTPKNNGFDLENHRVLEIEFRPRTNDLRHIESLAEKSRVWGVPSFVVTNRYSTSRLMDGHSNNIEDLRWIECDNIYYRQLRFFLHHPGSSFTLTNGDARKQKVLTNKKLLSILKSKKRVDVKNLHITIEDRLKSLIRYKKTGNKIKFISVIKGNKLSQKGIDFNSLVERYNKISKIDECKTKLDEKERIYQLKILYKDIMSLIYSSNNAHYISKWI